jgi:hypothetical protein
MIYELALLSSLLFDLILIAIGVVLLIKLKNKIVGMFIGAIGLVFILLPIATFLFLTITTSIRG